MYGLTEAQAQQLLHKHLTGELAAGANRQATIKELIRKHMFTLSPDAKRIIVTAQGKAWCDAHHMSVVPKVRKAKRKQ